MHCMPVCLPALPSACHQINCELLAARSSSDRSSVLQQVINICNQEFAGVGATAAAAAASRAAQGDAGGASGSGAVREASPAVLTASGWLRGAVEVLGRLVPVVAAYQGVKVVICSCYGASSYSSPISAFSCTLSCLL